MADDDVQLPRVIDQDGEVLSPDDALEHLATQSREALRRRAFLQEAVAEAEAELLSERNTFEVNGERVPNAGGYQDLAGFFHVETRTVDVEVEWEPNEVWIEYGEEATRHRAVAPVPEHCRALVTVRAVAPWGQVVERRRSCSTRDDAFRHSDGTFNQGAYMDAEHVCVGRAETRAVNAAIKGILGIQREEDREAAGAAEGRQRRQRKRKSSRLRDFKVRWKRLLRENEIPVEQERALARAHDSLPADLDEWDADCYEYALELVSRYGTRVFDRALQRLEEDEGLREAERKAGSGPEDLPCPEDGCDGVLKPEMRACPQCGWDREGPPPADEPGDDTPSDEDPESDAGEEMQTSGDDDDAAGDDFEDSIREHPLPPDAEVEGEETPQEEPPPDLGEDHEEGQAPDEPSEDDGPLARRSKLVSKVMNRAKELGEDRTYPERILSERVTDGATEDLDEASEEDLVDVLGELEDELARVEGAPAGDGEGDDG